MVSKGLNCNLQWKATGQMVRREMHQISQGRYKWGALDQGHDRGPSRVGHKLKKKQLHFILSQNLQQNSFIENSDFKHNRLQ